MSWKVIETLCVAFLGGVINVLFVLWFVQHLTAQISRLERRVNQLEVELSEFGSDTIG